jgi:general secretion pathway protein H
MRTSRTELRPPSRRTAGFTLIEILIVLTIVALAAAVVAPTLGAAVGFGQLRGEARAVVSGLREARAQAMTGGQRVDFRLQGAQWRVGEARREIAASVTMSLDVPPAGIDPGGLFIRFFPDGRSTGGRVHLRRKDRIKTIQVDWITGHAHQAP